VTPELGYAATVAALVLAVYGSGAAAYLVLGEFAREGSHATIKIQLNRMISWLWIGGLVLTLGAALAITPERRRTPAAPRAGRRAIA